MRYGIAADVRACPAVIRQHLREIRAAQNAVRFRRHIYAGDLRAVEHGDVKAVLDLVSRDALPDLIVLIFQRTVDIAVRRVIRDAPEVSLKPGHTADGIALKIGF